MASLTQRSKLGLSPKRQKQAAERLRSMECHQSIFVEPMPKYDVQKDVSWSDIASILFKALEKEQNVAENPESKPEQKYY